MELFQKLLNTVNRAYGQTDRNIFAGMLPGGSDSRLISAPQNPLRPASIVRSAPFQSIRDAVLEKSGLPKPEQFFIKGMTGGSKDITTMTPEELSLVKGAYAAKQNIKPVSEEELSNMMKMQPIFYKDFVEQTKKQYASASEELKNSPLGKGMFKTINTPFNPNQALQGLQAGIDAQQEYAKGPVTNLYGQGRDMKMAYGSLSVYPQPSGGVQIYDRWKVDKAEQVMPGSNKMGLGDKADRVADLQEGGPIPSLIYNAAKSLGTYEPFDIRVNVSPEQWKNTQENINKNGTIKSKEEQGSALNFLNTFYTNFKNKIIPSSAPPIMSIGKPLAP